MVVGELDGVVKEVDGEHVGGGDAVGSSDDRGDDGESELDEEPTKGL